MEKSYVTLCPWNLNSYFGRWMYYQWITNPKLNFISTNAIEEAKMLHLSDVYGLTPTDTTKVQLLYSKQIYENAIHPDTAEVQNMIGRLSFIPIGKSLLIATLLTQFSKNSSSFIWQSVNQTYDSFVNFTNRNADIQHSQTSQTRFGFSIFTATALSTLAAFHVERFLTSKIWHPSLYRFIPFSTLVITNIINVPIMRHAEIMEGVGIYDCNKDKIGYSRLAAAKGIGETIITRICTFTPGIVLIQYLEDVLDNKNCWFRKNKWVHFPFRLIVCGFMLIGMLPTACAIFQQFSSIETSTLQKLDKKAYCEIKKSCSIIPEKVYFNKGL